MIGWTVVTGSEADGVGPAGCDVPGQAGAAGAVGLLGT